MKRLARAVRCHWGIENGCHWTLDVTYREDESRIRGEHLRENFAWLNRFTLSLLKQHPGKGSIAMKRRAVVEIARANNSGERGPETPTPIPKSGRSVSVRFGLATSG